MCGTDCFDHSMAVSHSQSVSHSASVTEDRSQPQSVSHLLTDGREKTRACPSITHDRLMNLTPCKQEMEPGVFRNDRILYPFVYSEKHNKNRTNESTREIMLL